MNDWSKWEAALADPRKIGTGKLTIHPGEPWTGFFRVRRKGGDWEPVQFWQGADGAWHAVRSNRTVDPEQVEDLFLWAVKEPISEAAYDRAIAGEGWGDEPERPAAGIGHNSGADPDDPFEALRIEWADERELAFAFLKKPITSKEEADKASIWAHRLRDIAKKADKFHAAEKAPHLAKAKRVDNKWRELRDEPAGLSKRLKQHQLAWLQEQERLERDRQRAAAAEAERLRHEAAEALANAGTPEEQSEAGAKLAAAKEAEREAAYKRPQAGRTNEKTSLRTRRKGQITDLDAFLAAVKDEHEIQEACQRLANRFALQQRPVAGMEIVEERIVV
ncbi:hypothetical protein GOC60_17285 [Sinorhizobium meliloti]|nr:hypothetical protein [Sinorhizobium meliloti]MDX0350216.1 hypothetical protein [Sinorhizobium meliloti]